MFELVEKGSETHPDFDAVVAVVGALVADLLFEFRSLFGRLQKKRDIEMCHKEPQL
jgi:hypothetical protein